MLGKYDAKEKEYMEKKRLEELAAEEEALMRVVPPSPVAANAPNLNLDQAPSSGEPSVENMK